VILNFLFVKQYFFAGTPARSNPHFLFEASKRKRPFTVKRKNAWYKTLVNGIYFAVYLAAVNPHQRMY